MSQLSSTWLDLTFWNVFALIATATDSMLIASFSWTWKKEIDKSTKFVKFYKSTKFVMIWYIWCDAIKYDKNWTCHQRWSGVRGVKLQVEFSSPSTANPDHRHQFDQTILIIIISLIRVIILIIISLILSWWSNNLDHRHQFDLGDHLDKKILIIVSLEGS